jgi:hypothetical protein
VGNWITYLLSRADDVREISWRSLCRPSFLRVYCFAVFVELRLNQLLVLFAIWPMTRPFRSEREAGTGGASSFDGDVAQPFRNANRGLLHRRFTLFNFPTLGSFSLGTNESPRLSSAVRSKSAVATCRGLPDSFPSHVFSSAGVVVTDRPWRRTGIPSAAPDGLRVTASPEEDYQLQNEFRVANR